MWALQVSAILTAAAAGGTLLDDCMKEMMTMEVLDKDLDQYLGDLVRAEVSCYQHCARVVLHVPRSYSGLA